MPKGMVESTPPETGLTELRDDIRELEITAANLRGRGGRVLDVFALRDSVQERIDALAERGMDLRAELTRLETVDNMIRRQGGVLGRELAGSGGMERARQERRPPDRYWWWFADIEHAQRLRKSAIRYAAIIVGVLVVLLVGNAVLTRRYGLSPEEQKAQEIASSGERLIAQGDLQGAIAAYEAANEVTPQADSYLWLAALYTAQGQEALAEQAVASALEVQPDKRIAYNTLVRNYEMLGNLDAAEDWAYKALAIDDAYAQTWLSLGSVTESRGDRNAAIKLYEEAARLANEQGSDALYVLARMRMGMLMGGGGTGPSGAGF